ncbi:hypothetical protein HMF8227_01639 [Saliniradius amylolyticus]|uniref:Response regulatory domain-containing protein n=1 Tax=Saliniradius amylolyticus TaxID=2183582 RepID=A0A2S2E3M2_9ALTE|nr:response regulator [Saliniradius amylolyticus]AWL12112.1 hypothetical protein HMF8227_01639 [Saliniradius amylolyticus]
MEKLRLLLVEDEHAFHQLITKTLSDDYDITIADSVMQATDLIDQQHFDFALVDENLGNASGSQWIQTHHERDNFPRSTIIYSGSAAEETLLKALDCGASDFLKKPFSMQALKQKLASLQKYHERLDEYEDQLSSSNEVLVTALTQAAKFGQCMQLVKELNHCMTLEQMATSLQRFFKQVDLKAIIGLRLNDQQQLAVHTEKGSCSPLEEQVIHALANKKRVFTYGQRTAFNHEVASILVLNFARSQDSEIWIDALASLIESIASRIQFLNYHHSVLEVQTMLARTLTETRSLVNAAKQNREDTLNAIRQSIGLSFHVLDLSEEQEQYLSDLVEKALTENASEEKTLMQIRHALDDILQTIDKVTEQQDAPTPAVEPAVPALDDDILF